MERFRRAGLELRRGRKPGGVGEIPYAGEPSLKPTGVKGLYGGVLYLDEVYNYFNLSGFWLLKSATVRTDDDRSQVGLNRREMLHPATIFLHTGLGFKAEWQDAPYVILKSGEVNTFQSVAWHGEKYLEGEWCVLAWLPQGLDGSEEKFLSLVVEAEKLGEGRGLM